MDFETLAKQTTWKKIALIALGMIAISWLIHEIIFWSYYQKAEKMVNSFNNQFSETQKDIQQKIADSDIEFEKRGKSMDARSDDFQKTVEQQQKNMTDYLDRMSKEREARDAQFDKEFNEARAKMWTQFEKTGEEMRAQYFKDVDAHQDKFEGKKRKMFNK